jgi:hypothetical protein
LGKGYPSASGASVFSILYGLNKTGFFPQHKGHVKAKRRYGWQTGHGPDARFTAVLEIPPVDSPNTAVRAAIASEVEK